jgi:hypothetical protein
MKAFVFTALIATGLLAAMTYRPITVCTSTQTHTEVHCDGHYCTASTQSPNYLCYQSHE